YSAGELQVLGRDGAARAVGVHGQGHRVVAEGEVGVVVEFLLHLGDVDDHRGGGEVRGEPVGAGEPVPVEGPARHVGEAVLGLLRRRGSGGPGVLLRGSGPRSRPHGGSLLSLPQGAATFPRARARLPGAGAVRLTSPVWPPSRPDPAPPPPPPPLRAGPVRCCGPGGSSGGSASWSWPCGPVPPPGTSASSRPAGPGPARRWCCAWPSIWTSPCGSATPCCWRRVTRPASRRPRWTIRRWARCARASSS